VDTAL